MISWHAYLTYCGLYAIAIAAPGPGVLALVARALGSGFKGTLPAVAATALGDWIVMTLSAFGLALLARTLGGLFLAVKLAGAAYLLYLAYRYWTQPVHGLEAGGGQASARSGFLAQLGLTLGNPKTIAFFVALLPTVVDLHALRTIGYLQLTAATLVLIPAITLTYVALAARARGFLADVKARRGLNRTAAVIMAGAGVGVAVS